MSVAGHNTRKKNILLVRSAGNYLDGKFVVLIWFE